MAMADERNPYVFVVGCPRSGTTLLQRMLDNHPHLAVANDSHFIPRVLEKLAPGSIDDAIAGRAVPLTPELVAGARHYHRFHRLGLDDEQVEGAARGATSYREFVSALYTEFAGISGKPLGGEKTPDYVRKLPILCGLFPDTKIVHIIRDGRDVALSLLDWAHEKKGPGRLELWREQPVAVSALWWRWQVRAGRSSGAELGADRYHEVRYEDLVADPEPGLRRVSDFLGLPFAPRMLRFHVGKAKPDRALSAKSAWLPPTSGLRDWRRQMAEADVQLFEALAGDLLGELGFEESSDQPPAEIARLAARCSAWWQAR